MSFEIMSVSTPQNPISQEKAQQDFNGSLAYLKNSKLAKDVIEDLDSAVERIIVKIGYELVDKYIHPKDDDKSGGTIEWNPTEELEVIDKARSRPNVAWVSDHRAPSRLCGLVKGQPVDKKGKISAALSLMHEMGHTLQFLSNKEEYRKQKKRGLLGGWKLEDINVNAIENTIALELTAKGHTEGIRWRYHDVV